MIIDTNCSLGEWPFRRIAYSTASDFLSLMDRHGVTQAWVGAFEGIFYRDMAAANALLRERISGHEDRLIPWATINPNFPRWENDLHEALDGGMAGVRLYPNYHAYDLADDRACDLLGQLAEQQVPVALYHKVVDERLHHWRCPVPPTELDLCALLDRFPTLTILLCGFSLPLAEQQADLIRGHRVYMEISRVEGIEGVRHLCDAIGSDRVLLGSHSPYFYMQAAHLKIVEAGLGEDDRERVLYRNANDIGIQMS